MKQKSNFGGNVKLSGKINIEDSPGFFGIKNLITKFIGSNNG